MLETLRQRDCRTLFKDLNAALSNYIKKNKDSGWSQSAAKFSYVLCYAAEQEKSLLEVYEKTKAFADSLRGCGNYVGSMLLSDSTLSWLGSGSRLKEDLEVILAQYDPYDFKYIKDETQGNHYYRYGGWNSYQSGPNINALSKDSITILNRAVQDKTLYDALDEQCKSVGHQPTLFKELMDRLAPAQKKYRVFT